MLLFKKRFHAGLVSGEVTLTFRQWQKSRVKPGGRYRCHPIGVLVVDEVREVAFREITAEDVARAGFVSREELREYLEAPPFGQPVTEQGRLWRVALHHGGDGDRVETALQDRLSDEDVADIRERLARMDERSAVGPWTARTLKLIEKHPRTAASQLARKEGRETLEFKADVRKLKKLGLTQSFEVGYEISPRGKAYLARVRRR
ncbi:MAG: ASCH domain-containing protein [Myxococcota bacterium]